MKTMTMSESESGETRNKKSLLLFLRTIVEIGWSYGLQVRGDHVHQAFILVARLGRLFGRGNGRWWHVCCGRGHQLFIAKGQLTVVAAAILFLATCADA